MGTPKNDCGRREAECSLESGQIIARRRDASQFGFGRIWLWARCRELFTTKGAKRTKAPECAKTIPLVPRFPPRSYSPTSFLFLRLVLTPPHRSYSPASFPSCTWERGKRGTIAAGSTDTAISFVLPVRIFASCTSFHAAVSVSCCEVAAFGKGKGRNRRQHVSSSHRTQRRKDRKDGVALFVCFASSLRTLRLCVR